MAISKSELESLIERPARPEDRVLSVYLDIDQSRAANLNRGHLAALKDCLRQLEQRLPEERKQEYAADAERVLELVSTHSPRGRALVIFADASADFLWQRELRIPVRTQARWEEKPHVRPLAEALDEYERYAVVLVNRQEARLFTFRLGEIEERREVLAPVKVRRIKAPGMEHAASQINIQRKADEHARRHLKEVAERLDELAAGLEFDRLVLAGPHEVTTELRGLLSKRLQARVAGSIPLEMDASEQQVLSETARIEEQVERQREEELVEQLITAASKDSQGVLELQPTLDAMRQGRIMKLVYVHDLAAPGSRCTNCESLFAEAVAACGYCGAPVQPVEDVVERLVRAVIDSGGEAESVRGAAAERLRAAGRIGALLRY